MTEITCETQGHLWNSTGKCVMCGTPRPIEQLSSNPLDTAVVKLAVLKVSFGICALPEAELFRKLEEFYLEAYARGVADRPSDETTALPAVHGAIYDRPGWICSVCHGWNHLQDKHCTHTHAVRELTLKDFGYAPGDYSFHCLDCGQEATGDKRCSRCEPCAAQAMRENRSGLETTAHHCRAMDLANELARYFTSGNDVPVDRATVRRESDLFLILQEVLPDWNYTPMHSGQEKS